MEQDKKQKMLIALLAVVGLGAGSFYYFTRDSGTNAAPVVDTSGTRKERKKTDDSAKKDTRKERTEKTAAAPTPTARKERAERPEADSSGRKSRGKGGTEITKKKKIVPAA